jgi:hypothetical protein
MQRAARGAAHLHQQHDRQPAADRQCGGQLQRVLGSLHEAPPQVVADQAAAGSDTQVCVCGGGGGGWVGGGAVCLWAQQQCAVVSASPPLSAAATAWPPPSSAGRHTARAHLMAAICSAWNTYWLKLNTMLAGPMAASSCVPAHCGRVARPRDEGRAAVAVSSSSSSSSQLQSCAWTAGRDTARHKHCAPGQ